MTVAREGGGTQYFTVVRLQAEQALTGFPLSRE
jgi:hypothetical protein